MKIAIITFHFIPNQGAVLQCCATKLFLEKNGHEVVVIDYRPYYHTVRYCKNRNPFRYAGWYWKKHKNKRLIKRLIIFGKSFTRAIILNFKKDENKSLDKFDTFVRNNLPLTKRYVSLKQLKANPPVADVYISGSDQLWNPQLLDQVFDKAYFLDFGDNQTVRVSYAVSMGEIQETKYLNELKDYCKKFNSVSFREYDSKTVIATGRDVHICIDPTLLLEASDYEKLESKVVEKEPYIFVYGFEDTPEIHCAIDLAKTRYNCRIINGSPHRIFLERTENLRDYGPDRFLTLVKEAKCIVTNSFHGTAFSIIYKKEFITVAHSTRGNRMVEILGKLGLNQRLWGSEEFSFDDTLDWGKIYNKLNILRQNSSGYLLSAIKGISGEEIPHWDEEHIQMKY